MPCSDAEKRRRLIQTLEVNKKSMAQLPESHERDFLELLKPYVSEEQKRSRRNTIVSSFIVLGIYVLGKSLTDIRVFGVDLHGSNKYIVLVLAICMIIYWLVMYVAYSQRDNVIQSEQEHLLQNNVEKVKKRMDEMQARVDADIQNKGSTSGHWKSELGSAKSNYIIYENQVSRTLKQLS